MSVFSKIGLNGIYHISSSSSGSCLERATRDVKEVIFLQKEMRCFEDLGEKLASTLFSLQESLFESSTRPPHQSAPPAVRYFVILVPS